MSLYSCLTEQVEGVLTRLAHYLNAKHIAYHAKLEKLDPQTHIKANITTVTGTHLNEFKKSKYTNK